MNGFCNLVFYGRRILPDMGFSYIVDFVLYKEKRSSGRACSKNRSRGRVRLKKRSIAMYKNSSWSLFETYPYTWSFFETCIFTWSVLYWRDRFSHWRKFYITWQFCRETFLINFFSNMHSFSQSLILKFTPSSGCRKQQYCWANSWTHKGDSNNRGLKSNHQ